MKPEQTERFFIEELFSQSQEKGVAKGEVLNLVDKLTGDASTRRYYRLFTDKKSYVVCLDNPITDPEVNHPFVSYQNFLHQSGVRVPQIWDKNLSKGYILEEDLGDVTLLSHLATFKNPKEEYDLYLQVVKQLLDLHSLKKENIKQSNLFHLKFDFQKLMDEMDFTLKFFLRIFLKYQDEDMIARLREELKPVCERLSSREMVLTHRDFHSRNIMVKENNYIFIDFQDARWGIPQYDLVSLLEDCYYDLQEDNRSKLKKYYFEHLPKNLHDQKTYEEFSDLYDDMMIQRVFKAVGSFAYIYATRKDERYLKYIGFAMEKIRKMTMTQPRFENLRRILFGLYYVN